MCRLGLPIMNNANLMNFFEFIDNSVLFICCEGKSKVCNSLAVVSNQSPVQPVKLL